MHLFDPTRMAPSQTTRSSSDCPDRHPQTVENHREADSADTQPTRPDRGSGRVLTEILLARLNCRADQQRCLIFNLTVDKCGFCATIQP